MMKKTVIFLFLCLLSSGSIFSQSESANNQKSQSEIEKHNNELSEKWDKALGSFQFQIINSRINPQVHVSIIEQIEKNRLEDKVNYIKYTDDIRIMILPSSDLKKEYTKLELFKYIKSN